MRCATKLLSPASQYHVTNDTEGAFVFWVTISSGNPDSQYCMGIFYFIPRMTSFMLKYSDHSI